MLDLSGVPLANETGYVVVADTLALQLLPGADAGCYAYGAWVRLNNAGPWREVQGAGNCPVPGEAADNRPKIIVN
jgi:hypothetical protein